MNEADSHRLASALEKLGVKHTDDAESADILVLNTCVVRQQAEDAATGYITQMKPMKQRNPDKVLGVMGCMVGVRGNSPLRRTFPWVDVFMAPSEPAPMVNWLLQRAARSLADEETSSRFALQDDGVPASATGADRRLAEHETGKRVTANVPIVFGCSHACTFCIIPFRRGVERSRPAHEIVSEVRSLVDQGVREVTLLGQIVDRYGYDLLGDAYHIRSYNPGAASGHPSQELAIDSPLVKLLRDLSAINDLQRIRFLTGHPNWMTDELLDAVHELPKVMPHIEVPVQAGNDEVLLSMKRGYTTSDYRRLIQRIRERVPNASIATDVIVGFCGETEAQFLDTYQLLEELKLDVTHLARYSTRPHTAAERNLIDDVAEDEKMRRLQVLDSQQERIVTEINAKFLDATLEILVEDRFKDKWRGRTPQNKLVFFDDDTRDWRGQLVQVKITATGPWSMQGARAG